MKLAHYGEERLISELMRGFATTEKVQIGVGDDCAVIGGTSNKNWQLLKTDCIIEDIHFSAGNDPTKVGWKALARPLSDIAAMGGIPEYALITIAAASDVEVAYIKSVYVGIKKAARKFDVIVVGGETSRSPGPIFLSVCVTGAVEKHRCIRRSGGQPEDYLYVTGYLGGSIKSRHLEFIPRIHEARWLTKNFSVHAMLDLSDGLATDLPHLAHASKTGFEIFETSLPCTKGATSQNALCDGEDYELLFAIPPKEAKRLEVSWKKKFPKLPITHIGYLKRKSKTPITKRAGYDHFG